MTDTPEDIEAARHLLHRTLTGEQFKAYRVMLRARSAQARAELIAEMTPVAWSNPDEEGEPDMLFPSRSEAESYCDDDEEPIELVIKPKE
ncbi:hypothetical protein CAL14_05360 [Bordetella genomosp. 9]|uniref:hypothetical protein n=1 Tax=Bordetella genomosp. 9 TaxID=1416803 RepID=UPI000A28F4C2|nr:hypothetical protein [Bordetella genomosp. 9]ARP89783.1 hypothetical protein CAL14_05360 [Bordetella genomosp. 9]